MRSWKKRTKAQHKARYGAWKTKEWSDKKHESQYVLTQIRKGNWGKNNRGLAQWEAWWSPIWRSRYWRREKVGARHVKKGLELFAQYPYYEDCRYHVCRQVKIDVDGHRIDIEGESLINGTPSSCSYEHCGIRHLSKEEGEERAAFINTMGMMPYQLKYVYGIPEDRAKLLLSLRYSLGMDRVWNFNENGGTQEITPAGKTWLLETTGVVYDDLKPMEEEEMIRALEDA